MAAQNQTPFLTLAPIQSSSYPASPVGSPAITATPNAAVEEAIKRSSSVSSTCSEAGFRFLKLGPKHGGEPASSDYAD